MKTDNSKDTATAITVSRNDPYDVAVIDYQLPDGNGNVLLEQFIVIHPDVVCIMMTTDPALELALAWMRQGAAANLHRPFEHAYLLELCVKARPDIPVILASGYDEASVMSESHPDKPQAFLSKPYRKVLKSFFLKNLTPNVNQDNLDHI